MTDTNKHPQCAECGATDVRRDAWTYWNRAERKWELGDVWDHVDCAECGSENIEWTEEHQEEA